MKNLLAISWCMPPIIMPRSIQVSRLLAALVDSGWQSDVVCVDPDSFREGVHTLDVSLERPAGGQVRKHPVPSLEDWILVRGLNRLFPSLNIMPDGKWVWKNAAFRKCESLVAKHRFDALVSFAQPWTDHLVGLQVKEITNLPWIAHFSDPWVENPYVNSSSRVKEKLRAMERAVIEHADAVVFVSQQTADLTMEFYPAEWKQKAVIIPHGYETDAAVMENPTDTGNSPVEFVYTGNFYGRRKPQTLLEAASRLNADPRYVNRFRLRFVGPGQAEGMEICRQLNLENIVHFEGAVTFEHSQEFCRKADVLLVIDSPSDSPSVFLPSKLIDYLAFRKPILGITPLQGCAADLIRELGCPVVDPTDVAGIADELAVFIDAKQKGSTILPTPFETIAGQYHIKNAAGKLNELLNKLTV